MPKLKFSLPGHERYNTLMSIVALLQRIQEIPLDKLAKHFDVSIGVMRSMLSTLNTTSFMPRNAEEQLPFFIDLDRIDDEDGMVSLDYDNGPQGVPLITASQSVALLAGLHYLESIPEFQESEDVSKLIALLGVGQASISNISVESTKFDNDLAVLQRAILTDRRISCKYVNNRGVESIRLIDPLLLTSSEDKWFLRGYCLKSDEVRTFRLDHMVEAVITADSRSIRSIEAAQALDETAPIYSPSPKDTEVLIELAPEAYQLAALGTTIREPGSLDERKIQVTLKMGHLPDLGPLVCRYGIHAKVLGPAEARAVVRKYAEQSLKANYLDEVAE